MQKLLNSYMFWYTGLADLIFGNRWFLIKGILLVIVLIVGTNFIVIAIVNRQQINRIRLIIFITGLFGLGLYAYFSHGDILGGDAHSHTAKTWLFNNIVREEGSFPIWSNRWYFGCPIFLYYGFLYYMFGGLTALLFNNDVIVTTKFVLWLLHVLSGICMFSYVRLFTRSDISAFFSATFYVFSFQHLGTIFHSGFLTFGLVFLLLPVLFASLELFWQSRMSPGFSGIVTASVLSLIIFTHFLWGLFATITFYLTAITRFVLNYRSSKESSHFLNHIKFLFITGIFLGLFSSWFLAPIFMEKQYLVLSASNPKGLLGFFSLAALKRASTMLLWSRVKHDWIFYYVGLVPLCIAFLGSLQNRKYRDAVFWSYFVSFWAGFVLLLLCPRFTNMWFFLACVLSAYGILKLNFIIPLYPIIVRRFLFPSLFTLLLLDLGLTLIQRPFYNLDNSKVGSIQKKLNRHGEIARILTLKKNRETLWSSLDVLGTNASSPFGGNPLASTMTYPYVAAIASKSALEILDNKGGLSNSTYDALRFLNIRYLLIPSINTTLSVLGAYPAWFSQRLIRMDKNGSDVENETWASVSLKYEQRTFDYSLTDYIFDEMKLDSSQPIAKFFLLHHSYSDEDVEALNPKHVLKNGPSFTIDEIVESHYSFQFRYHSNSDGFLHISYSYFPFNKVLVDGKPLPAYKSATNFIIVPIPKGEHMLTIKPGLSLIRHILIYIALSSFLLTACFLVKRIYNNSKFK